MSQLSDELPFLDYVAEEAEHLIGGDREWPDRAQAIRRPVDQPAFPSPAAAQATAISPAPAVNYWQHQSSSGNESSESSPAVSAYSNVNAFGYTSQHASPNPYMDTYVSPMALQTTFLPGLDFLPWVGTGTGDMIGSRGVDTSKSMMALASPALSYEPLVETPEGGFSNSDLAAFMDFTNMTQQQSQLQGATQPRDGTQGAEVGEGHSHYKHAKKSVKQDVAAARGLNRRLAAATSVIVSGSTNAVDSRGKGKLRSASRSSKNIQIRFAETVEERKTRNSHNLVEKQYRNRLNAQFENLLNTLPDAVLPARGSGSGRLDSVFGFEDKKLSKGEVLDLSMRYIRALERDCSRLEREREELKRTVDELHARVMRDSGMSGPDGSGGGSGAVLQ
ncbi:hypothetical protein B0H67DRAFT_555182 [Lasiosphaeris hirsuta]|uniref:BHLH domain-containing protein n=1 Tax=Lasiosphaeris hirsuta TaxID=260670 RepID=A0AA40DRX0_9PEZI|nr:hypothetical protein B0H67DRAFT_555182 [Lasiosphaeris hirsuta]